MVFYVDSDGTMKVHSAEMTNAYVSGKFVSDSLETFDNNPEITSDWGLSQNISGGDFNINWGSPTSYDNSKFIKYVNGIWYNFYPYNDTKYSYDLTTWYTITDLKLHDITYGNNIWIGRYSSFVYYSSDGINWSSYVFFC